MHKFIVNVNGTSYEVEVEEIDSAAAGETASAPKKAAPKAAQLNGSEKTITAPMPGSILAVNVKPGDSFRSGQVLLILDAENGKRNHGSLRRQSCLCFRAERHIRKLRRCSHRIRLTLSRHIRKGGVNHAIHHKGFYRFCA